MGDHARGPEGGRRNNAPSGRRDVRVLQPRTLTISGGVEAEVPRALSQSAYTADPQTAQPSPGVNGRGCEPWCMQSRGSSGKGQLPGTFLCGASRLSLGETESGHPQSLVRSRPAPSLPGLRVRCELLYPPTVIGLWMARRVDPGS